MIKPRPISTPRGSRKPPRMPKRIPKIPRVPKVPKVYTEENSRFRSGKFIRSTNG